MTPSASPDRSSPPAAGGIPQSDTLRQYHHLREELQAAVQRVFQSGWFILGREVKAFEEEFARYCGAARAVGVGSGTAALTLALQAVGVRPGDQVLTAPNTAFPTAAAILACGARPAFADIDEASFTLDPDEVARRITPETKAIVPVHLYGHPADMTRLLPIAEERGIPIVEDACQAHGARLNGRHPGTFGAAGCFSFYPSKNLGAYGDAGMILTSRDDVAEKLTYLRNYGQTRRYYHDHQGINSRLDELQAALLRVKLPHLDSWVQARRDHAASYRDLLAGSPVGLPSEAAGILHSYHQFVIRIARRDELLDALRRRGIQALIHYPVPLHFQKALASLGHQKGDFPVAERVAGEILSLPLFPELSREERERVAQCVNDFLGSP